MEKWNVKYSRSVKIGDVSYGFSVNKRKNGWVACYIAGKGKEWKVLGQELGDAETAMVLVEKFVLGKGGEW